MKRVDFYMSLPPLDPRNTEEARVMARCVDPNIRDQVGIKNPDFYQSETEKTTESLDEPNIAIDEKKNPTPKQSCP